MDDKATSVAMDRTVDLMKLRLPYLEQEINNNDMQPSSSLRKIPNTMSSKITQNTPRTSHVDSNSETGHRYGSPQKQRQKFIVRASSNEKINQQVHDELSDRDASSMRSFRRRKKREDRPMDTKSMIMARYADRALFLDGKKLQDSLGVRPVTQHKKKRNSKTTEKLPLPIAKSVTDMSGQPAFSTIHRSKTELEIIDQATEMLKESGFTKQNVLQQDIEKLSKGLSSMYLSDYGIHRERTKDTAGMSQQKRLLPPDRLDDELETTAEKHIYMCQIPSLMSRGSQARRSIHSLRRTITPRTGRYGLESGGYLLSDTLDSYGSDSNSRVTSPRKLVHDQHQDGLRKKGFHSSLDNLPIKPHRREVVPDIDIQSTAIPLLVTTKRIM